MKKLYTFIILAAACAAQAQPLTRAEKLYQEGDFASALPHYQEIIKTASGDTLYQAQLRTAACLYSQGEYLTAAKTMLSYTLPQNPVWKARFLLYRTQLANQVSSQYNRILETHEIEHNKDPEHWTYAQWQAHQEQDYEQLWALRADLINAPIEEETLILNLKDTDIRRIPTLFDFATQEWIHFLESTDTSLPAGQARTYLGGAATPISARKNQAQQLSYILQTAYQLEGTGRQNARLFWQTDFILLPFTQSGWFEIKNKDKALTQATTQLQALSDLSGETSWWKKLKQYMAPTRTAATDYAKSYAAYQNAMLLYNHDQRAQALALCNQAAEKLSSSYYTQQCRDLTEQITRKELFFRTDKTPLTPSKPQLTLTVRNVAKVYARVYPITKEELEHAARTRYNSRTFTHWNELTQLTQDEIKTLLTSHTPYQTAHVQPAYDKPYFEQEVSLSLPELAHGFYVVLASHDKRFDTALAPVSGLVINITDLALFTTAAIEDNPEHYVWTLNTPLRTYTPPVFHFYTVNLKTGQPEPGTLLHLFTGYKGSAEQKMTDKNGTAFLSRKITVDGKNTTSYEVNTLAEKNGQVALSPHSTYLRLYNPQPIRLYVQTDRAIYRPGQKVQLSVQAFERTPRSWQVWPSQTVQINVRGANGKQIFQAQTALNAFGTAQLDFTLPDKDLLLGHFSVHVSSKKQSRTFSGHHSFQVEEYKRPDYEITLQEPTIPLAYHKKAVIPGKANYYTGLPVQDATVNYTITRQTYVPFFYWWRIIHAEAEQIAQGQTKTDRDGNFQLSFTPQPARPEEHFTQYTVQAEVYDKTGRAIATTRTYKISTYAHLFKVDFTQGFYDANTPGPLADITLTDTDGNPATGTVTARVSQVEDTPTPTDSGSLDAWYEKARDTATVFTQTLSFKQPGPQTLQLPAVAEGIYRLTLQDKQAQTQSLVFVVAAKNSSLQIPSITLPQHKTYYPGETARVLLGAGKMTGPKWVEVYYDKNFLRKSELVPSAITIYEYPVAQQDRGGLGLAWFGASDYTFYHGSGTFEVPYDNQELFAKLNVPNTVKPGQNVSWQLTTRNATNFPVNGQASITVYDKSLDYYAKKDNPFTLTSLFAQTAGTPGLTYSFPDAYAISVFDGKETHSWTPAPHLPTLNLVMPRRYYKGFGGAMPMMAMAKSAALSRANATADFAMEEAADFISTNSINQADTLTRGAEPPQEQTVQPAPSIRTDFAETAYFNTLLPLTNGAARVRFTLPQSITTWNMLGYVLTKNAQLGTFTASTVSRKDVTVQLNLPRFFREEDHGVVQAAVSNTTNRKITTAVTLSITKNNTNQNKLFGVSAPTQTVTVPAHSTAFAHWEIDVPNGPGLYQLIAVARHGKDSDAEQHTLPVLPSRTRLLASAHAALKNGTNTLSVTELDNLKDASPELAALTLHPSLALSVLHKLPNLLANPYNDLISSLNRYVPLAIVHQFYNTYPELKEAVKKLPSHEAITAPWEEDNPTRLTLLAQTPWWIFSQDNQQRNAGLISLFNDKLVAEKLSQERERINRFQNASGAFSWFAGGPDDPYLTLRALDSFAQAIRFGAQVPQENVQKAISYVVPRMEKQLLEDKTGSAQTVSYALYAAYVLSSFPANWPQMGTAKSHIQKWADFADTQARFLTPLGQTYAAAIYHRLGDDVKANAYLDKVLTRMKTNELTGAYFAPEAQSWLWYQDTLTTQTATLKTLLEIRPDSAKIDPMVQWLLFNKQVSSWQNPSAAAQAVSVLLDVIKTKGALTRDSSYDIQWADMHDKKTFEPLDWTEDLQWVKQKPALTPSAYHATITKQSRMTDFASLNVVYTSAQAKESPKGVLNVSRTYFVRFRQEGETKLRPITDMEELKTADEVEVHLTLTAESAFDYVQVTDPKPAGFENTDITSGWSWNPISMYREVRDSETNFFINRLPMGKVTLRYTLRPTLPGTFHASPSQVQSMYAPEFGAHGATEKIYVGK